MLCFHFYLHIMLGGSALILTYYAQYYAREKTCASFCTYIPRYNLITILQNFSSMLFFPFLLALCSMLLETYYAQNCAGIIGLGLTMITCKICTKTIINLNQLM